MKLQRFYIPPDDCELSHSVWAHSKELRNQLVNVFRYREGAEVVLFDGVKTDRLYKIAQIEPDGIKLDMVTDFERKLPVRHVYLLWSLLKKDKNEWVIQKCTELGVSNFVPIIAERSEKMGFNMERAQKIAIEAAEQCGRSDIPFIREPISLHEALSEYAGTLQLLFCEEKNETDGFSRHPGLDPGTSKLMSHEEAKQNKNVANHDSQFILHDSKNPTGVLIGPEGGWTDQELELFKKEFLGSLHLGNLTLRAETAAVAATTKLFI